MKKIITISAVLVAVLFAGCESKYRYACQDPNNWGDKLCQRPYCEANGLCTDELLGRKLDFQSSEEPALEDTNCNCNQGE
jgi:hypothetical protein